MPSDISFAPLSLLLYPSRSRIFFAGGRSPKRARPAALEARVSTIELPGLSYIFSVLAVKGGKVFISTESALFLRVDGHVTLLAGHPSKSGFKDGKGVNAGKMDGTGPTARFNMPFKMTIVDEEGQLTSRRRRTAGRGWFRVRWRRRRTTSRLASCTNTAWNSSSEGCGLATWWSAWCMRTTAARRRWRKRR